MVVCANVSVIVCGYHLPTHDFRDGRVNERPLFPANMVRILSESKLTEVLDALRFVEDTRGVPAFDMDCVSVLNIEVLKVLEVLKVDDGDGDGDDGDDDGGGVRGGGDVDEGALLIDFAMMINDTSATAQIYYLKGNES
jgi:hypothetical protein